jgi:hypothetical protein
MTRDDPPTETLARGYQPNRVPVRAIALAVVLFIAFAAVTHVWLWFLVKADSDVRPADRPRSVVRRGPGAGAADAPPLQPTAGRERVPPEDVAAMRAGEDAVLRRMGSTSDPATGRMRPPEELVRRVAADRTPAAGPVTKPWQVRRPCPLPRRRRCRRRPSDRI